MSVYRLFHGGRWITTIADSTSQAVQQFATCLGIAPRTFADRVSIL